MFNPFSKPLCELTLEDLKELRSRSISEGLYIEYKKDFPSNIKIAHSIASFANSHGGFYFIGIQAQNGTNIPENFNGFSMSEHNNPKEQVRDIIRDGVDPIPRIDSHLVKVEHDRAILVMAIPESDETPHITRDGRIYRRNAEGSDPIPENDRIAIDRLYAKATHFRSRIEAFCQREFSVSKGQANDGVLEVYVMPYPFDKYREPLDFQSTINVSKLKDFLATPSRLTDHGQVGVPFNTIYPSNDSIIFRQTTVERLGYLGLTYQQYYNGNCKIIIPFVYLEVIPFRHGALTNPAQKCVMDAVGNDVGAYKLVQGFSLLSAYVVLLSKHVEHLRSNGWKDKLLTVHRVRNSWHSILFLDSEAFRSQVQTYGLPICLQNEIVLPRNMADRNYLTEMPDDGIGLFSAFIDVAEHFGIFGKTLIDSIIPWADYANKQTQARSI